MARVCVDVVGAFKSPAGPEGDSCIGMSSQKGQAGENQTRDSPQPGPPLLLYQGPLFRIVSDSTTAGFLIHTLVYFTFSLIFFWGGSKQKPQTSQVNTLPLLQIFFPDLPNVKIPS